MYIHSYACRSSPIININIYDVKSKYIHIVYSIGKEQFYVCMDSFGRILYGTPVTRHMIGPTMSIDIWHF